MSPNIARFIIGILALCGWGFAAIIGLSLIGRKRVKAMCIDDGQVANPNYSQTRDEIRRMIGGRRHWYNAPYHYRATFEWEEDGTYYQGKQPVGLTSKCAPGREYIAFVKPGRSVITLGSVIWTAIIPIFLTIAFFAA